MVWGAIAGALIGAGANYLSQRSANDQLSDSQDRAIGVQEQAQREQLEFLRQGRDAARGYLEPYRGQVTGGVPVLRQEAALDPSRLTPAQEIGLEDLQRRTLRSLSASGLRGSGRAGMGVVADALGRYQAQAQEANRSRKLNAAGTLMGAEERTVGGLANNEKGMATAASGVVGSTAGNISRGILSTGTQTAYNTGQAIGGTGNILADTLGAITGQIAADEKKRQSAASLFNPGSL